ncbi:Ig-like domain-containing protein [Pseudomonas botevensis]|uniref:Ig-like domain-containing protein n=1 Tax=Pseudomonas botevensis TaxID=2842352 RepID=UPI001C3CE5D1|nr:Ig-like domain-containing protein [Pseudomonas botevensis]MBV4474607.1 Ig-like domain-containing protein [Pseudomonas botevensis]
MPTQRPHKLNPKALVQPQTPGSVQPILSAEERDSDVSAIADPGDGLKADPPVDTGSPTTAHDSLDETKVNGLQIELFDGNVSKGIATVNQSTGIWSLAVHGLALGTHSLTAKALYGAGESSEVWRFTVVQPFSIDTSLMELDGVKLLQSYGFATREVPRNTMVRQPTGGVPSVTYSSSNPSVAQVDAFGKVYGLRSGTANITARDGAGAQVSYPVRVSKIYTLILSPITDRMSFAQIHAWGLAQGGIVLPGATDSTPVSRAFRENFSNYHQFFRQITPGMDPRYKAVWQAPTQNNIVAAHYIKEDNDLHAIAWGPEGVIGFEGPAFTLVPT